MPKSEKPAVEKNTKAEPLIVNADNVEYSTENKVFSASGNVIVIFQDTKLSCDKLSLNSQTKECQAEGNVRMEDLRGTIEGSKLIYNFDKHAGTIFDSQFRANPFFGKTEKLYKVSDAEYVSSRGYMTTCSFDNPHWRMKTKKMDIFPGDKIQVKDATVYVNKLPLLYMPQYTRSLREPLMKVQVMPGTSKTWGPFMLTAWRYNLTEDITGRIYVDYRSNFGIAEGLGTNYDSKDFGKGDFKFYYTQERDKSNDVNKEDVNVPKVFQRYLVRLRHKWDVDERTNVVAEYHKITDSKRALMGNTFNFLKDYFPREYETDQQPLSYVLMHHAFAYSNIDVLLQPRVNTWFSQEVKMPEIKYNMPSLQFGNLLFYLSDATSFVSLKQKFASPADNNDKAVNSFSTNHRLSRPVKIAFLNFNPFVGSQQNFSDEGAYGSTLTNIFSGGTDASTKFYKIYNWKTKSLGLDINELRHIITPTVSYTYSNSTGSKVDELEIGGHRSTRSSIATLGLENKLQTKRKGQKTDLADLRVASAYNFRTTGTKGQLSDFLVNLELYPYSWLSLISDATYKTKQGYFSTVNYDVNFNFGIDRSFGFGQRYQLKGNNEITYQFRWRLNPKWKFSIFQRINRGSETAAKTGLREQEYSISRDFHCWTVDLNYNTTRGKGDQIWLIFRLKAFPELEFEFNKNYHAPRPGSQSEPNM
ncbi:MAG: hypothetical protein PHY94_03370 [Candidatus Omnitrophica bacterium]|nr:hypothetical protein [Candidatus Omnitrophota bacterium]